MQLTTPLAKDFLLINRLRCSEGLNRLFRIELDMLHEETPGSFTPTVIEPECLLGKPMVVVALQAQTSGQTIERYFHGICVNFMQGSRNGRFTGFQAELVPRVWLLTQVSRSRIFQNVSVPDILRKLLTGFDYDIEIQGTFEPRNYCVQYRESDWDFASRLMEEEGIYYYFEHTANHHRLILANTPTSHRPCPTLSKITFALDRSELYGDWIPSIFSWQVDSKIRTGKTELWDFNFQLPNHKLQANQASLFNVGENKKLEYYDWSGGYAKRFDGIDAGGGERPADLDKIFRDRERTVIIRQQEIDVSYKSIYGSADCCTLTAGYRFEFTNHPIKKNNINHVLVQVEHDASQSPNYISDQLVHGAYRVNFVCVPHGQGHAPFRPARRTPKPMLHGGQTAFVVGDPGQEIFTDKYGRVKVQFHWDREGRMDGSSSCWLRVAHSWAGNGWGSMFIPRVGMEVMVHFLEGDPDQPIITGCVYNPANMPPYKLPEHKTRSGIKTSSTVGGKGFNELRFEDKKGKEQIFIHAERNQDIRVKNTCKETIGADRHLIVHGEQYEKVCGDKHQHVVGDLNEKVDSSVSLTVGGDKDQKIRSKYAVDSGNEIHLKAGMKVVIEAGVQLTLKGPGGFIDINPGGVTVQGTMVLINSGGSAGSGTGASPTSPKPPTEADKADSGKAVEPAAAPPPPPSPALAKAKVAAKKVKKKKDTSASMSPAQVKELMDMVDAHLKLIDDIKRFEKGKRAAKNIAAKIVKNVIAAKEGLPFLMSEEQKRKNQEEMRKEARMRSWKSGKPEEVYPGGPSISMLEGARPTPEEYEELAKDATKKAWKTGKSQEVYKGGPSIMPLAKQPPPELEKELTKEAFDRSRKSGKMEEVYHGGPKVGITHLK